MDKNEVRPFGIRDKVGYMLGDVANDFSFIFASSFVVVFYSKVMGISTGLIGTMFLVSRCIDAFADIGMGRICFLPTFCGAPCFTPPLIFPTAPWRR